VSFCSLLTPSLPWCHLKTTNKSAKSETVQHFCLLFRIWHVNGFSSDHTALKADVLLDRKIYCLQARPCIFQPENVTGRGSEGVKGDYPENSHVVFCPNKQRYFEPLMCFVLINSVLLNLLCVWILFHFEY